jgi:hypothetical protein
MLGGAGSLISACTGIRRSGPPASSQTDLTCCRLDRTRSALLYYASLAPSGHNSQPWYVKVLDQNRWIIGADPLRRLPAVDPHNREVLLSLNFC